MKYFARSLACACVIIACPAPAHAQTVPLRLELVAEGLANPLFATAPPGDPRVFVLEKNSGRVRIVRDGEVLAQDFASVGGQISTGSEQGLLGMAFHPDYANNGVFFLSYTDTAGDSILSRWQVSANPDEADAASETVLLNLPQQHPNHNGGMLAFGPDGFLYYALGDGSGGGDAFGNAQNLATPLGAILRLDIDTPGTETEWSVPGDNPFLSTPGADPRIWVYGFRNPWRFSFDRLTGDVYIGDVGQDTLEEINFVPAGSLDGSNFGWPILEGPACYPPGTECEPPDGYAAPIASYGRDFGNSVTGGYVYRGGRIPWLRGTYFYGDFTSARISILRREGNAFTGPVEVTDELRANIPGTWAGLASFGEDGQGELLVAIFIGGRIFRIVPETPATDITANGMVDAVDVQLAINAALRLDVDDQVTDVNGDGTTNAVDVQAVINGALGILPPEQRSPGRKE